MIVCLVTEDFALQGFQNSARLNPQSILFAMICTTKCSLNICKTTLHARLEPIIYWISFSYKGHIDIDTTLTTGSTKFGKNYHESCSGKIKKISGGLP